MTLYSLTSVPGDMLYAGMTFGIAEGFSMLFSSYVCTKIPETKAFSFFCCVMLVSQTVFYFWCNCEMSSLLALAMMFCTVVGSGSNINIIFLMIGKRASAEKLGSLFVVVITFSIMYSSFSA
jgi:predicted MFS family arabinose efflux permease